ncbi:hypothetical protein CNR27_03815 [Luteimonas chenhongjianii]|uniref:Uncharacterized protein n=2 Tax=Luteimonas chenhongjianii TaxID=2006110 RepID=A0A290XC00_9GAMM|nr:hypothetical protein CNR27_03815 [Luteimonas chenhongjianii]
MLTVSGVVLQDGNVSSFLRASDLKSWAHYAGNWAEAEKVSEAPSLTLRERFHFDQVMMRSTGKLPSRLAYLEKIQSSTPKKLIARYRRYQRFFPKFQNVDI